MVKMKLYEKYLTEITPAKQGMKAAKEEDKERMIKWIIKNTHKDYKTGRKVMPPINVYGITTLVDLDKSPYEDIEKIYKAKGGKVYKK